MKKSFAFFVAVSALLIGGVSHSISHKTLCEGIVPPNNLNIPVGLMSEGNVTEDDFNDVLDQIEAYYTPIVEQRGASLDVRRLWENGTVNASAQQWGSKYIINMYGGLARHETITKDGFMLVACHEMGHHLGGAPKYYGWASNEGQADYFSTLKCLRFLLKDQDNFKWIENNEVDPVAQEKCQELYNTQEEENLCTRLSMAGMSTGRLFQALREEEVPPAFNTPDPSEVSRTNNNHPATQCRLDTYYNGALCVHDINSELSDSDPLPGTCNRVNQDANGLRPLCWYKPENLDG